MANWFELAKTYPLKDFITSCYGLEFNAKHKCLCPFHADTKPSLSINTKKTPQTFRCFTCGTAGSIIDFVIRKDGYDERETLRAAKFICKFYGEDIDDKMSPEEEEAAAKRRNALIANNKKEGEKKNKEEESKKKKVVKECTALAQKLADNLYEALKNDNTTVMESVRRVFPNMYMDFDVIMAYVGWDYEHDSLCTMNRNMKDGTTYNIKHYKKKDHEGNWFNGKWISTPNSSTAVMGMDFIKRDAPVFVVEGEKDMINLMLLGCNAVTLGGASTDWKEHAEVLRGRDVIVWFDNDKAGYVWGQIALHHIKEVAKSCVSTLFYYMGSFPNKYDVSDWLVDHKVINKEKVFHDITYSSFASSNTIIDEIVDRHTWTDIDKWMKQRLLDLKKEENVTSFYENIPEISKYIIDVRGEKDKLISNLQKAQKHLAKSANRKKMKDFVNSLFPDDQEVFFKDMKQFNAVLNVKTDILTEFRQTHIYDIYNGVNLAIRKAGFDLWKFRGQLYFWTGSYFCIVTEWEINWFVFNVFMPAAKVEQKKILNRNSKEVIENLFAAATPMEMYVETDARTVNVRNGVLIIRKSGKFTFRGHHQKTDCATSLLDFEYNPNATCPKWDKFLKRVLPEEGDRLMLEEFMGYCLMPTHEYEHFLYMHGATGANGKSVIIEVIRGFFSPENVSSLDLIQFKSHELDGLVNKFVNMGSEVTAKNDLSEQLATLKKLVSPYDTISVDPKFEKPFVLYPHEKPKCIFAGNEPLSYDADDGGVLRRLLLLTFNQTIEDNEKIRDLPDRLKDESSGILNRLLSGIDRLAKNNGFTLSDGRRDALEEFKRDINPVRAYIHENLKEDDGICVPKQVIYTHYKNWAELNGGYVYSSVKFWTKFKEIHKFTEKRPTKKQFNSDYIPDRSSFVMGWAIESKDVPMFSFGDKELSVLHERYSTTTYQRVSNMNFEVEYE